MRIGDMVRVRASGREGQIVEDLDRGRYRVAFDPVPTDVLLDMGNVDGDVEGGIFSAGELNPL
jgi:hypothetical protein